MPSVSQFRKGMAIRHENDIWVVSEFEHHTPGNLRAMLRTRLKNVRTGRISEVTFRMSDTVEEVRLEGRRMDFLYAADGLLHFMDPETYDQMYIATEMLGDQVNYLKENSPVTISFIDGAAVTAEVPNFVELAITEAEPSARGNTATNMTKNAIVETGAKIQVPAFIKEGDKIKIDTRTGKYVERVSSS
jgi:elongation factor P